jgi:outer membrane protein OmpA-like peptidoglycan-associated protein
MRGVMRMAIVPALVLLASGCATKDWVKDLVGKREAEIDQRVATRVGAVEGRVEEQSQKVTSVESKVGEVGESATQARSRADSAYSRADEVNDRLSRLWTSRNKRTLVETIHVQFAFDRWDLSDSAQTALLGIVKELRENPNLTVDLEGFTDSTGPQPYNVGLSQRRVESVRRYLIEQGTEMPRVNAIGLGPLGGGKSSEDLAKQRRVTVRLMLASE